MNCPNCNSQLTLAERREIEIDFCPECRGVWLDRGELDKIIERAGRVETRVPEYDDGGHRSYPTKKKRKSFLGELFDL